MGVYNAVKAGGRTWRAIVASIMAMLTFWMAFSASAEPAAEATPAGAPAHVTVGVYINDIQNLDFPTNTYAVDLYVWFRWKPAADLDPTKTFEFMNAVNTGDEKRTVLLDAPKPMPDGTLYNAVRYQGRFSTKFRLEKYPFDTQQLAIIFEDSVSSAGDLTFVPDTSAITTNPKVTLPGFKFAPPMLDISPYTYPTNFGDLEASNAETYSRVEAQLPLTRPLVALGIKTFVPILLIVVCTALVFFIHPQYVEGRIGLAITALLTLVALQLTASSSMPDVDYLTLLDKIYLATYAFIIAALFRVVVTSWRVAVHDGEQHISTGDHRWGAGLLVLYALLAALMTAGTLLRPLA